MSADQNTKRSRKPATLIKFGIASLAILGLGGAITAAAWQDTITFEAQADAASFDLVAKYSGMDSWRGTGVGDTTITIPAEKFAGMWSGETREINLAVKNIGTVAADIEVKTTVGGDLFDASKGKAEVTVKDAPSRLAPEGYDVFTLSITAPEWNAGQGGYQGEVTLEIVGTPAK